MAEPVRNTETGGRSLADILREAGIENPSRSGRRRRWDDVDDAGIRQRRADAEDDAPRAGYGRRSSDLPVDREPRRPREERSSRDERTGRVERVDLDQRPARDERPSKDRRDDRRAGGGRRAGNGTDDGLPREGRRSRDVAADPSTAAIPGLRASRTPSVPGATGAGATTAAPAAAPERDRRGVHPSLPLDLDPATSTGPIPALQVDDVAELAEETAGPRESALAWLRFAGELVIAAAAGVGIYFAFTVLWQTVPHLAVLLAPLAVTALVAGVSVWRQRLGHAQVGPRLLAVLVFAGTLLTVLPAAGLITHQ